MVLEEPSVFKEQLISTCTRIQFLLQKQSPEQDGPAVLGHRSLFLSLGAIVHVVHVDQVAVQVASVRHLQRERAVTEDAHVTLELCWRWDLVCGRFWVIGHLTGPGSSTVEAGVIAALRSTVADVTPSFMAAVDALVVLLISRSASLGREHKKRRR